MIISYKIGKPYASLDHTLRIHQYLSHHSNDRWISTLHMNYSDLPPWPDVSRWVLTVTKTVSSSRIPVLARCHSENPRTSLVTAKAFGIEHFIPVSTSSILLLYRLFGIEIKVISSKPKRMYNKRELKRLYHNFSTGFLDSKLCENGFMSTDVIWRKLL